MTQYENFSTKTFHKIFSKYFYKDDTRLKKLNIFYQKIN